MMYRHNKGSDGAGCRNRRRGVLFFLFLLLAAAGAVFLCHSFIKSHSNDKQTVSGDFLEPDDNADSGETVVRRRLDRKQIPYLNHHDIVYRELFDDSNRVQLTAARRGGINPSTLGNPDQCKDLVLIKSTDLYHVDTMWHARPYLTHDAALLLRYVGLRFRTLMKEHYPELSEYRIIVTSALRTEESERSLRRVNRNATDTSCHMYGTTFDLSSQRFKADNGRDTVVEACKQILALALYELRYEGLCYVKYERRRCFHTTVRATEYSGKAPSSPVRYAVSCPEYVMRTLPKEAPVVKPEPKPKQEPPKTTPQEKPKEKKETKPTKEKAKTASPPKTKTNNTKHNTNAEPPAPPRQENKITDRERISFENYERRGN